VTSPASGDVHDFDFLHGKWAVEHRRLRRRLVGSDDWETFSATYTVESRVGGRVSLGEFATEDGRFRGLSVRLFDAQRRTWSLNWIDDRSVLFPPLVGNFTGDRGEFLGADVHEGRPVRIRIVWLRLGEGRARMEQAFSLDGEVWEINWTMDFRRL
jgi:hypothetical protein